MNGSNPGQPSSLIYFYVIVFYCKFINCVLLQIYKQKCSIFVVKLRNYLYLPMVERVAL